MCDKMNHGQLVPQLAAGVAGLFKIVQEPPTLRFSPGPFAKGIVSRVAAKLWGSDDFSGTDGSALGKAVASRVGFVKLSAKGR